MNLRETICQKTDQMPVDMIHMCNPNPSTREVGKDQEFKVTYTIKPVPDLNKAEKETSGCLRIIECISAFCLFINYLIIYFIVV